MHFSRRMGDQGLPTLLGGEEPACQCSRGRRHRFDTWGWKIPWQPTPVFLPEEIPMDRGAWQATVLGGHRESDITEHKSTWERSDKEKTSLQTLRWKQIKQA